MLAQIAGAIAATKFFDWLLPSAVSGLLAGPSATVEGRT
jgi:hypothetical protein